MEEAKRELTGIVDKQGQGSLYAVLSPMMACEEAYLLGKAIRTADPQAMLILGPVPDSGKDEVFHNPATGKQTFTIKSEKVPNAAGIRRVMQMLGGPRRNVERRARQRKTRTHEAQGWLDRWRLSFEVDWPRSPAAVESRDSASCRTFCPVCWLDAADVVLPAAAWAEKDGCWENFAGAWCSPW